MHTWDEFQYFLGTVRIFWHFGDMDDEKLSKKPSYTPQQARLKAEAYCAFQERSQQEVRDRLYGWGMYKDEVEAIIADLITDNFINEERFARSYASGKFTLKGWGRLKIKQGLQYKAVSRPLIALALNSLDEAAYRSKLLEILEKKAGSLTERNPYKRNHQLWRHAQAKGYESDIILEILKDNEL